MAKRYVVIEREKGKAPIVKTPEGQVLRDYSKAPTPGSQAAEAYAINERRKVERQLEEQQYGKKNVGELTPEQSKGITEQAQKIIDARKPQPAPVQRTVTIQASNMFGTSRNVLRPGETELTPQTNVNRTSIVQSTGQLGGLPTSSRNENIQDYFRQQEEQRNQNKVSVDLEAERRQDVMRRNKPGLFASVSAAEDDTERRKLLLSKQSILAADTGRVSLMDTKTGLPKPQERPGVVSSLIVAGKETIKQSPKAAGLIGTAWTIAVLEPTFIGEPVAGLITTGVLAFKAPKFAQEYEKARRTPAERELLKNNEKIFEIGDTSFLQAVSWSGSNKEQTKWSKWKDTQLPRSVPLFGGATMRQIGYSLPIVKAFTTAKLSDKSLQTTYKNIEVYDPGKYTEREKEIIAERIVMRESYEARSDVFGTLIAEGGANIIMKKVLSPRFFNMNKIVGEISKPSTVAKKVFVKSSVGSVSETVPTIAGEQGKSTSSDLTLPQIGYSFTSGAITSGIINTGIAYGGASNKNWLRVGSSVVGQVIDPIAETSADLLSEFTSFTQKRFGMNYQDTLLLTGLGKKKRLSAFVNVERGTEIVVETEKPSIFGVNTQSKNEGKVTGISVQSKEDKARQTVFNNYISSLISSSEIKVKEKGGSTVKPKTMTFQDIINTPEPVKEPLKDTEPQPVPGETKQNIKDDVEQPIKEVVDEQAKASSQQKQQFNMPIETPVKSASFTTVFTGGGFPPMLPLSLPSMGAGGSVGRGRKGYVDELSYAFGLFNATVNPRSKKLPKLPSLQRKSKKDKKRSSKSKDKIRNVNLKQVNKLVFG